VEIFPVRATIVLLLRFFNYVSEMTGQPADIFPRALIGSLLCADVALNEFAEGQGGVLGALIGLQTIKPSREGTLGKFADCNGECRFCFEA
jgi:hypothetical protein